MIEILNSLPRIRGSEFLFTLAGVRALTSSQQPRLRRHAAINEDLGVEAPHWTLHDLRRTLATGLQRLGFPVELCEAVPNHSSATVSGVAAIYARHSYDAERRAALEGGGTGSTHRRRQRSQGGQRKTLY